MVESPEYAIVEDVDPVVTGPAGEFEIRGNFSGDVLRVTAAQEGRFLVEPIEVVPGARDLSLVLARAGSLVVSLTPYEGVRDWQLSCRLVPWQNGGRGEALEGSFFDNECLFQGLQPGRYDFELRLNDFQSPLLELSGVSIEAGRETRLPELQQIHLGRWLQIVSITLLGPLGQPLPMETVWRMTGTAGMGFRTDSDGVARVPCLRSGADIEVHVEEYRWVSVDAVTSDQTFVLQPAFPIAIEVHGELPDGVDVDLRLRADENSRYVRGSVRRPVTPSRRMVLYVDEPGTYRLRCRLRGRGGEDSDIGFGPQASIFAPAEIVVRASEQPQEFRLQIDEEGLIAAVAEYESFLADRRARRRK